ncbi:hypothetical protein [Microscilla marina]|uniref:Uncharacterized protein n=1 Tax=Microscilla marina ATCC 23134 TaxID=313606 RepID=A2A0H1_MICM2|nr:hypothetical protein [Microscilla marina]EAY23870.1 hypothetical protein M23134_01284 [Microscilla marina ATCC 23134]
MKQKIWLFLVVISLIYVGYYISVPHCDLTYYYSKDKRQVVTAVHYFHWLSPKEEKTFYTYGFYDKKEKPQSYVEVYRTYKVVIDWKKDHCVIRSSSSIRNVKNLPPKMKVDKSSPTKEMWKKMKNDKSGKYTYIYVG